jgi:hypothetical protein
LEILQYSPSSDAITREQYYLYLLKPEYNISKYASAPMLGRNHSEESNDKNRAANIGIPRSEETKAKISACVALKKVKITRYLVKLNQKKLGLRWVYA